MFERHWPSAVLTRDSWEAVRDYAQGPVALIPAVVLLLIIRAMGDLGGWGIRQVLALSLGMTTSVLVTAGFVQGMSRRASVCLAFGDMRSAIRFLRGALLVAAIGVSAFAVSVVTVAQAVGVFAPQEVLTFLLSFLGLSTIWLLAAGLSLLRASGWLGAGLAGGLALGVVVDRSLASLPDVHLAAGALAGFLSTVAIISWALHRAVRLRSGQVQRRVALPPAAYLFWEASPYFAYGALYAVLLFIPHALGWVAVALGDQPRLWAVASLEAGLCLSLLPLILANGVAERTLQQFWRRAAATQATIPGHDPAEFNRTLTRFYWRQLVRYLVVLSVFTGLTYLVFRWTVEVGLVAAWLGLSNLDVVVNVFAAGLGAYWLLGWGLFNCMFPLTMACPNYALRALLPSTGVVIVVGLPLSLGLGFGFAAVAAIVGSAAYVLASSRMTVRMFRAADYYYASAF